MESCVCATPDDCQVGTSPGSSSKTPPSSKSRYTPLKDFNDEPDETFSERLWGLTEMFPENVRESTYKITTKTWCGVKCLYQLSRNILWIVASSSVILFAPVIFETERSQVDEMQKSQQKQVLLGPNVHMSGIGSGLPPMPR